MNENENDSIENHSIENNSNENEMKVDCNEYQMISKSTVQIKCISRIPEIYNPLYKNKSEETVGSGFLFDILPCHHPCVITCAHVVENAVHSKKISIFISGKEYNASIFTLCLDRDVAILKLDEKEWPFPPISKGIDTELKPLSHVVVIGYELGGHMKHRKAKFNGWQDWRLQLDGAINQGDSGAPVFHNYQVVGWITSGVPKANRVSWANPICMLFTLQLENCPLVQYRPVLPFSWQKVTKDYAEYLNVSSEKGIIVLENDDQNQNVKRGDLFLTIDNYKIENGNVQVPWHDSLSLEHYLMHKTSCIFQNDSGQDIYITLKENKKCCFPLDPPPFMFFLGMTIFDQRAQCLFKNANQNDYPFVTFIAKGSPCENEIEKGIQISSINNIQTKNIDQIREALIKPLRKNGKLFISIGIIKDQVLRELIFKVGNVLVYESLSAKIDEYKLDPVFKLLKKVCESGLCH